MVQWATKDNENLIPPIIYIVHIQPHPFCKIYIIPTTNLPQASNAGLSTEAPPQCLCWMALNVGTAKQAKEFLDATAQGTNISLRTVNPLDYEAIE